jgi:hypothetical protein
MKIRLLVMLAVLSNIAYAETIYVPGDFPTIQIAIHEAEQGDTIILAPQTYYEAVSFAGKRLTIQSEDPLNPDIVETTAIDALGLGSVVTFLGNEDELTALSGVTIQGGNIGADCNGSKAIISHCRFTDNDTAILGADGNISHSTFFDNIEGIEAVNSTLLSIENCSFTNQEIFAIHLKNGQVKNCH